MGLEGRVALVTGAAGQGMGRSIALTLAREGADIVVNYRSKREGAERVAAAIERMGRRAMLYGADVAEPTAVEAMLAEAEAKLGKIDILVHNAGGRWKPQDITEIHPVHFRAVLADEIESAFLLLRGVLPGMRARRWGRIVLIGGHLADNWPFGPPEAPLDYPLGKAARHWLARTLGPREHARGITVNAVAPGPTPHVRFDDALAAAQAEHPGAPGNTPQDVAGVVAFLCSEAASRVTGAVISVPGTKPV